MGAAVIAGSAPAGSGAVGAEGCRERRAAKEAQGGGRPEAPSPPRHPALYQRASVLVTGSREGVSAVVPLRSLVLSARETDWARWLSSISWSQQSQRSPENLLPARRRCCSARWLRFRWSDLRGLHFSTRRAAAKGPLKGGASAAPGPPPLVRLRLRDWPAPRPTAFTFPSRVFPGDLGRGSRRDSAAAAGTEGGSRAGAGGGAGGAALVAPPGPRPSCSRGRSHRRSSVGYVDPFYPARGLTG